MDYDTGEIYAGPRTLKGFALPPGKTPLFVGGKGIVVERVLEKKTLAVVVYPVSPQGTKYVFTHADGVTRSAVVNQVADWNDAGLAVTDTTVKQPVAFEREPRTRAIRFALTPGHSYEIAATAKKKAL